MIENLEINHLRTLDALYRFGQISAAAEYLGVTQQAVSFQLKRLRVILSDPLFIRNGYGINPTCYARQIAPFVQRVLTSLHEIPMPGFTSPALVERTLTISATDYTQRTILGPLLRQLRDAAPKVRVLISNVELSSLTRKMYQGELDLSLTCAAYVPAGLITEPLFVDRYICVAASGTPAGDAPLPLEQLVKRNFIVNSVGTPSLSGSADAWLKKHGLSRDVVISAPSLSVVQEYLRIVDAVAFIPSRLMPCPGLLEIPIEKYPPGFQVVAGYHPIAKDDQFMRWILTLLKRLSGEMNHAQLLPSQSEVD